MKQTEIKGLIILFLISCTHVLAFHQHIEKNININSLSQDGKQKENLQNSNKKESQSPEEQRRRSEEQLHNLHKMGDMKPTGNKVFGGEDLMGDQKMDQFLFNSKTIKGNVKEIMKSKKKTHNSKEYEQNAKEYDQNDKGYDHNKEKIDDESEKIDSKEKVPILLSISTSTEVKTRQTIGQAKQALDLASACVRSFFVSIPPPFCYKKGVKSDIIAPFLCDCGYFRVDDLCYENCEHGWKWVAGICYEECPAGWSDIGVACVSSTNDYKKKASKISYSKANSDSVAICPYGYFKSGSLCYKDCSSLGLVNCGNDACAVNNEQCREGIINNSLESALGMSSFTLFLFSFGASSNLPISDLREASVKSFNILKTKGLAMLNYFTSISNTPEQYQTFLDRVTKKSSELIVKGVPTKAVKEICSVVGQELASSLATSKKVKFNADAMDSDLMLNRILSCGSDMSLANNRILCANSIISYINFIDPTGISSIISAYLQPSCNV